MASILEELENRTFNPTVSGVNAAVVIAGRQIRDVDGNRMASPVEPGGSY